MNKKLPSIYVNKIDKKLNANSKVYYSFNTNKTLVNEPVLKQTEKKDVTTKIKELFNSPNYVYKMKATITLHDNTIVSKEIIGQTKDKLITMDEETIDIKEIKDINF